MPVQTTVRAAARIKKLKRYATYLGYAKGKGFFVKVVKGVRSRPHRVLKVTQAAKAALGTKIVRVSIKGKEFAARVRKPSPYKKAISLAASQIGVKESPAGSNHTKYGEWYPMDHQPWCAIFVSWVLSHVGRPFKESYVPHIVSVASNRQEGLATIPFSSVAAAIKAGHVVLACYDWPGESPGVADHVGFVEKVLSGTTFTAIEGNTAPPGGNQSNGGEVCRQTRITSEVQAFVLVS